MEPDFALNALDPGLQQLLTEIAEKHFGAAPTEWEAERTRRVRIAEMLVAGLTRQEVAEHFQAPLSQIPFVLTAAPNTLQ